MDLSLSCDDPGLHKYLMKRYNYSRANSPWVGIIKSAGVASRRPLTQSLFFLMLGLGLNIYYRNLAKIFVGWQ